MYNWSVDEQKLAKDPEKYAVWKLEQAINFGLGEEKIRETELKKYWDKITIDQPTRDYLEFLLWPRSRAF